ncbi:PREDICTED: ribosome-binding protein 1-like [Ipomoea nil]|uniref:ribosome-binding protein 1-like n=1 Tax=Ipomoea nil TaxID=35883 RepID=UPI000901E5A3|nr:PREDICTED: ribosome-binding protein 1-like [Ipomoea nil]
MDGAREAGADTGAKKREAMRTSTAAQHGERQVRERETKQGGQETCNEARAGGSAERRKEGKAAERKASEGRPGRPQAEEGERGDGSTAEPQGAPEGGVRGKPMASVRRRRKREGDRCVGGEHEQRPPSSREDPAGQGREESRQGEQTRAWCDVWAFSWFVFRLASEHRYAVRASGQEVNGDGMGEGGRQGPMKGQGADGGGVEVRHRGTRTTGRPSRRATDPGKGELARQRVTPPGRESQRPWAANQDAKAMQQNQHDGEERGGGGNGRPEKRGQREGAEQQARSRKSEDDGGASRTE